VIARLLFHHVLISSNVKGNHRIGNNPDRISANSFHTLVFSSGKRETQVQSNYKVIADNSELFQIPSNPLVSWPKPRTVRRFKIRETRLLIVFASLKVFLCHLTFRDIETRINEILLSQNSRRNRKLVDPLRFAFRTIHANEDRNVGKALLRNPTRFRYFRLIVFPDPRAFRLKNIAKRILDMHGEMPRP